MADVRHILSLPILILPFLGACDGPALVATAGVNVASLTLVGRTVPDLLVSGVTGRDCSIVRLDRGMSYCGPAPVAPGSQAGPQPYCTRSRGSVDCWVSRPLTIPAVPGILDGPVSPTPAQEADRTARWPGL